MIFILLAALVFGYLLGSLNFGILLSRGRFRKDVRQFGSGNAGATNMLRTFGKRSAAATFAGDALKCVAAILTVRFLTAGLPAPYGEIAQMAAGTGTFVGHCYPLYFGFKGGKGMVVGTAILALIDWRLFLAAVGVFLIVAFTTKMVSASSISGAFAFAVLSAILYRDRLYFIIWAVFMFLFTLFTHRANIVRILNGTESKIGEKKEGRNINNGAGK